VRASPILYFKDMNRLAATNRMHDLDPIAGLQDKFGMARPGHDLSIDLDGKTLVLQIDFLY